MTSSNQNDKQERDERQSTSHAQPPGERRRDEEREGHGPTYKGSDWSKADRENDVTRHGLPEREGMANDDDRADARELDDPGTRGAVFGRGGVGLAQHEDDKPAKPNPKNS